MNLNIVASQLGSLFDGGTPGCTTNLAEQITKGINCGFAEAHQIPIPFTLAAVLVGVVALGVGALVMRNTPEDLVGPQP